jgi:hypothetical protein
MIKSPFHFRWFEPAQLRLTCPAGFTAEFSRNKDRFHSIMQLVRIEVLHSLTRAVKQAYLAGRFFKNEALKFSAADEMTLAA